MTIRKKKDNPLATEIHPELYYLIDRISRLYKLHNGKTALYWHLIVIINDHIQKDNITRLGK